MLHFNIVSKVDYIYFHIFVRWYELNEYDVEIEFTYANEYVVEIVFSLILNECCHLRFDERTS